MDQAINQLNQQLKDIDAKIEEVKALASDPAMAGMAKEELEQLTAQRKDVEMSLKALENPQELQNNNGSGAKSLDANNAIVEIRAGAGGDEAKIFAEDLLRMYLRFAESKKLKPELIDDGVVKYSGKGAYGLLKYEAGVHRVQRVPVTESQGRIHTSTASVAVLPEVTQKQIEVKEEDLDWKFTRAGGHGGQNVNKLNTAVMLTHKPTGIVVNCRQERRQQQNRAIALDILRSKLWEIEEEKHLSEIKEKRTAAVGRAMRAEKIRTYNYPQNRVTDHRLPKSWKNLDQVIEGNLDQIINELRQNLPAPSSE